MSASGTFGALFDRTAQGPVPVGTYRLTRDALLRFARDFDPQDFHLDEAVASTSMLKGLSASGWQSCALQQAIITTALRKETIEARCNHISEVRWLQPLRPERLLRVEASLADRQPDQPDLTALELAFIDDQNVIVMRQLTSWSRTPIAQQTGAAILSPSDPDSAIDALAFEDLILNSPQRLGSHRLSQSGIDSFNDSYDALAGTSASLWHVGGCWMRAMIDHRHATAKKLVEAGEFVPEFGPSPGLQNVRWWGPVCAGDSLTFYATTTARRQVSKPGWGLVTSLNHAVNQHGQLVMEFQAQIFMTLRSMS